MALNKSDLPAKRKSQRWFWLVLGLSLFTGLGAAETRTVVFFGDSLTAGYGLDPDDAFTAVIQRKIDAAKLPWRVVNAGLSGETTAGGLRRVDWILRQRVDVFVLELGGNDGLRGIDPVSSKANLQAIIDRVRARYPAVVIVLAGMQLPTNMGPEYSRQFAHMYPDLVEKNHLKFIPFLLEAVGGIPRLNQADGIHPTAEGDALVAETIWKVLLPLL